MRLALYNAQLQQLENFHSAQTAEQVESESALLEKAQ